MWLWRRLTNKMIKRALKFYALGVICLVLFFVMEHTSALSQLLEKTERVRIDWSFGFNVFIGLIRFSLVVSGISLLVLPTYFLLKKKYSKKNIHA